MGVLVHDGLPPNGAGEASRFVVTLPRQATPEPGLRVSMVPGEAIEPPAEPRRRQPLD